MQHRRGRNLKWGLALMLALALSGCVSPPSPGSKISEALASAESEGTAVLDLGEYVPGRWTRMLIVCGGSRDELSRELGFRFDEIDPGSPGFLSAAIFADDDTVVSMVVADAEPAFDDHWYFHFCSSPSDDSHDQEANIYARERGDTELSFRMHTTADDLRYWTVPHNHSTT